jgi:2-aminoadipate transaminase
MTPRPPLRKYDDQWVFYIGSFSKILAPAFRVGWVVVPEELTPKLSLARDASDLDVASFSQRVITAYLETGHLDAHLPVLLREYRRRRDTMMRALTEHFPEGASWVKPVSGFFVWVELPEQMNTDELLMKAVETEQVAFVPGHHFGSGAASYKKNCMRLNFSTCTPEQIEDGIARLGRVIKTTRT